MTKTLEELSDTDKFKLMLKKTRLPNDDDTGKYLVALVSSLVLGIVGVIVVVTLRPDYDILVVSGIIFAFLTPTTTSILALIKTEETKRQAIETHLSVNSRLDAFIKQAAAVARAEGIQEGEYKANLRTDELSKTSR